MIDGGSLKTVPQVMNSTGELQFKDEGSYQRLRPRRDTIVCSLPNGYEADLTAITTNYPNLLIRKLGDYTREPADPYLILCARAFGVSIITEEKHYNDRTGKKKWKKTSIPDVCEAEGIPWLYLEDFLRVIGILP